LHLLQGISEAYELNVLYAGIIRLLHKHQPEGSSLYTDKH